MPSWAGKKGAGWVSKCTEGNTKKNLPGLLPGEAGTYLCNTCIKIQEFTFGKQETFPVIDELSCRSVSLVMCQYVGLWEFTKHFTCSTYSNALAYFPFTIENQRIHNRNMGRRLHKSKPRTNSLQFTVWLLSSSENLSGPFQHKWNAVDLNELFAKSNASAFPGKAPGNTSEAVPLLNSTLVRVESRR